MNITKKALTIITIILINFMINTSFVSWQLFPWLWPNANWGNPWPLLWPWPWWMSLWNDTNIYNKELWNVINTQYDWNDISWPLNDWAYRIVKWEWWNWQLTWLVWTDEKITDYSDALSKILRTIQNVVNYTLWILSLIALIYLIIHWFIILTAAGDDSKVKKWFKWIKNAFLAIAWIWLSRIIISFIIWLINTLAG